MPHSHTMVGYTLRVFEDRDQQSPRRLDRFDGSHDAFLVLKSIVDSLKTEPWDDSQEATLRATKVMTYSDRREIAALVDNGRYGVQSEFKDRSALTGRPRFRRTIEDAEIIPTLVLVKLPSGSPRGFVVAHEPYGHGIKTRFWDDHVDSQFRAAYPGYNLRVRPAVPADAWKQALSDGNVKKVRLIRRVRSSDPIDGLNRFLPEHTLGTIETHVIPQRRVFARKKPLEEVLKGEAAIGSLLEFDNSQYDEIKVEVTIKGRNRTINLGGQHVRRVSWDVSDELDTVGSPSFESLLGAARGIIETLEATAGWQE